MACKECSYPLLLDFGLLARQKLLLLELLAEHKGTKYDEIEGIVYMIDAYRTTRSRPRSRPRTWSSPRR